MKTNIINKTLALTAAAIALMGATTACVNDNSLCVEDQPGYEEGKDVWLTFTIKNQKDATGRSRADVPTDPLHPDEDASADENYIDPSDVTIMLADNNGYIWKIWNAGAGEIAVVADKNNQEYEFITKVNQDYFNYASGLNDIPFTLLVVANTKGIGSGNNDSYTPDDFMQTPWSLSQENRGFDFPADWTPSIADNRHIPMSGLVKASMTRASFEGATDQSKAVDMGTIYLQRNIAKVRVVDAIAKNGDADHVITAVTLTGATNRGSFIPYMGDNTAAWAGGTSVVEYATVKEAAWYSATRLHTLASVSYRDDLKLVDETTVGTYPAFRSYITEYDYDRGPTTEADRPTLHITVTGSDGTVTYDYPVSNALGATDMARNHIYQFIVTAVSSTGDLTINWTVCDMDNPDLIVIPPFGEVDESK